MMRIASYVLREVKQTEHAARAKGPLWAGTQARRNTFWLI